MELFDLINEENVVIGQTSKEESHATAQIHRVVAVFVFSPDGRLYVQKREDDNTLDHSVGGHVQQGESYDNAATRETDEELGLTTDLKKLSVFLSDEQFSGKPVRHMFGLYECTAPKDWNFAPTEEVKEIMLMSIEEITTDMQKNPQKFSAGFINTMKEYRKIKKNG